MSQATVAEWPSTSSMLDMLMARWQLAPRHETAAHESPNDAMERARATIEQTVGHYVSYLEPADQALYATLIATTDPESLRDLFFECFDLMVRTRGPAIAVLRLHELYRLMR
jgi:hypothetical protein